MPETAVTQATLLANFADQTTGLITPAMFRQLVLSSIGECGGIHATSGTKLLDTNSVALNPGTFSETTVKGNVTTTLATSRINLGTPAVYLVSLVLEASVDADVDLTVSVNLSGTPQLGMTATKRVFNTPGQIVLTGLVTTTVGGQYLQPYAKVASSTGTLTITACRLTALRVC